MRIGVLTGGGDCPGLNAVIRAIVRKAEGFHGHNVLGFRWGWKGVVHSDAIDLTVASVRGILNSGGTMLGTSRFHPHRNEGATEAVLDTLRRERVDAVVCVGGDGTLGATYELSKHGVHLIGVPKTIDNDVRGTDRSVGFDTAVHIATEAIDRLRTTAESHDRVMVVEVMGHHAGWVAVTAGIAAGADIILYPEEPFDIEETCNVIRHRHRRGSTASIVVVAEGAKPKEGTIDYTPEESSMGSIQPGAIGERVRDEIQKRTGYESRVTVLGHIQRGGAPTYADRLLGSRFGVAAVDAIERGQFGVMTALRGDAVVPVPLSEVGGGIQDVPRELREVARVLSS